jgi:hypothetical protein
MHGAAAASLLRWLIAALVLGALVWLVSRKLQGWLEPPVK